MLAFSRAGAAGADGLPVKKYLPLSLALEAAQAALLECSQQGLNVAVSVVDRSGATRLTLVSDGAGPIATDTSRRKAFTSAVLGLPTGEFGKLVATFPVGTIPLLDPAVLTLAGGLPIKAGNDVIAGIGVGGADLPAKDEMCALAGINKIKAHLN
jgi:uncharacterized protein GlcG (DUF336 family)